MSFYGLEIARKSLVASQQAIQVTGHNMANVNTQGYSKQVVNMESIPPSMTASMGNNPSKNIGGGVLVSNITQVRSAFYDTIYRSENTRYNEMETKASAYLYIEDILGEGEQGGVLNGLECLYSAIDKLAGNAQDSLLREEVRQYALSLTENLNTTSAMLYECQQEQDRNVATIVGRINTIAQQVSDLNEAIFKYELSGNTANDLRDDRNQLVDELSGLVDISVSEGPTGEYGIKINGMSLVEHTSVNEIILKADTVNPVTGTVYSTPYWSDVDVRVNPAAGTMKAALDIRDGSTPDNRGISYYLNMLDNLAGSLVQEFNAINRAGYTLPYGSEVSESGVDFFDPAHTHATDIRLSDRMMENASNIAASSGLISGHNNWSNYENLQSFLDLRDATDLTYGGASIGNHVDYMQQITMDIAVTGNSSGKLLSTQKKMVDFVSDQRMSISGVSLDEEAINLVKYQHSYAAAAKMITAIDEMLQIIINM